MANATVETEGYGLSTWDEETPDFGPRNNDQDNSDRIPFLRLTKGDNEVRIITAPYKYHMIRYKGPKVKAPFGARVNCAYPKHDDCPAVEAGFKPKVRYLVGVIKRADEDSEDETDEIRIFDMSIMIYKDLKEFKNDKKVGKPENYDLNIRYNPEADPQGKYTLIPRGASALSEEDVALIDDVGETLNENLLRLATPPTPERVKESLKRLGWVEGEKAPPPPSKEENQDLQGPKKDDFGFPKHPAAPDAAN
jgi:hypothetical protein